MTMSCDDAGTSGAQRLDIFTGARKRRDWPPEVKVSIVAESYSGQESGGSQACDVPFTAIHLAPRAAQADTGSRAGTAPPTSAAPPLFVPAAVEPSLPSDAGQVGRRPRGRRRSSPGAVELEIDGVAVKIARGADKGLIASVIEALRATR